MKRSIGFGYAIAPISGPLLYSIIVLFFPEITDRKEFSIYTWSASLVFFSLASYIMCFIFGIPIVYFLKRLERYTAKWIILIGSLFYSIALYIFLFHILEGKIVSDYSKVVSITLLVGFGLGVVVTAIFSMLVGLFHFQNSK